jgi:hypothetical protein
MRLIVFHLEMQSAEQYSRDRRAPSGITVRKQPHGGYDKNAVSATWVEVKRTQLSRRLPVAPSTSKYSLSIGP